MDLKDMITQDVIFTIRQKAQVCSTAKNTFNEQYDCICTQLNTVTNLVESADKIKSLDPNLNINRGSTFKVLVKKLVRKVCWWFIEPLTTQINLFHIVTLQSIDHLRNALCVVKDISWDLKKELGKLDQSSEVIGLLKQSKDELESFKAELFKKHTCLQDENRELRRYINDLTTQIEQTSNQLAMLTTLFDKEQNLYSSDGIVNYLDFENKYRGSEDEIKQRLSRYLIYFNEGDTHLDLGCGRGEFLELTATKNVIATGVDICEPFIQMCIKKGLQVVNKDIFEYLNSLPDNSIDIISSIQVIEHLTLFDLKRLLLLTYMKLKDGGRLILETQNPKSAFGFIHNFYIDPSHIRPVHPELLMYMGKESGFTIEKEDYPEYAWVNDGSIPPIKGFEENESLEQFNMRIEFLNNFLYGSTDYAIIFKKICSLPI